ncbi:MAG: hypothetical protein RJA22_72 [Verrucomicrobiota bacterium]|jgi:hypothetical protein
MKPLSILGFGALTLALTLALTNWLSTRQNSGGDAGQRTPPAANASVRPASVAPPALAEANPASASAPR